MIFSIYCSIGEIVDKISILNIKKNKTQDLVKLYNINKELKSLFDSIKDISIPKDLYCELLDVNNILWNCEDDIRLKSANKEFDSKYIEIAEKIHITNDRRFMIKNKINQYFKSDINEVKIYNLHNSKNLQSHIDEYKNYFADGKYIECYNGFRNIITNNIIRNNINYENNLTTEEIDILVSYLTCCSSLNCDYEYLNIYEKLLEKLDNLNNFNEYSIHIRRTYLFYMLGRNEYSKSLDYLKYNGDASIYHMNCRNTSFIENDNDVQFIYIGGGLGDHIMFARLIKILAEKYPKNKIIYFTMQPIKWLMEYILQYNNVLIISNEKEFLNMNLIKIITKHCSLFELFKFLKLDKQDIYNNYTPLFKNISIENSFDMDKIINNSYIFNWKGNPIQSADKYQRKIELKYAEKLFKQSDVQFILINKDELTSEEKVIINKYSNVYFIGNIIDNDKAFYDTINIMRRVKGVITTDTALIHLSANLDVLSYLCLTYNSDWRWGNEDKCIWYPNINIIKQEKIGIWNDVIDKLINIVSV